MKPLRVEARFRDRAHSHAYAIGDRLLRERLSKSPVRGLIGLAGFALLYGALGIATEEDRFVSAMHRCLREAAHADDFPTTSLFGGISGLRAVAALVARTEPGYARLVAQCDAFVDSTLPDQGSKPESYDAYDLVSGWSGARVARCVDGPRPADRLVDFISWTLSNPERWRCPHPLRREEVAQNDLGLAHGVAGMLASLCLTLDRLDTATATVVAGALALLHDAGQNTGNYIAWPTSAGALVGSEYRSAWCYGAAGILSAIHSAALALNDGTTARFAVDAMSRLAAQPMESWLLENEALCHGLMGNALCFASVASVEENAELWNAAVRLAAATMDNLDASDGRCRALGADLVTEYEEIGLVNGVSGIALALLTLSGDAEPSWMRLFGLRPIWLGG